MCDFNTEELCAGSYLPGGASDLGMYFSLLVSVSSAGFMEQYHNIPAHTKLFFSQNGISLEKNWDMPWQQIKEEGKHLNLEMTERW